MSALYIANTSTDSLINISRAYGQIVCQASQFQPSIYDQRLVGIVGISYLFDLFDTEASSRQAEQLRPSDSLIFLSWRILVDDFDKFITQNGEMT